MNVTGDIPKLRRSCLESVADIFDDLLLTIHRENGDDLVIVHAHLSVAGLQVRGVLHNPSCHLILTCIEMLAH